MQVDADVAVIGAGAAGLWAAEVAAREGASVVVLEKTPRTGTKVLASGGTRCNLTTTLGPDAAARLFGPRGGRFLATAFRILPPAAVRERFHAWGVPTVEAPLEKVFPASGRARDVRDALERAAAAAGARIRLSAGAVALERDGGEWSVRLADGGAARARRLIVCPGGASYARTGTTGDGYAWLSALGLRIVAPVPALVPLRSPEGWVRELAGIALQETEARLLDESGRELGRRARPVLFTHEGLSGPGAMDLSEPVARAECERGSPPAARAARDAGRPGLRFALALDLCPALSREELRERLLAGARESGGPLASRALGLDVPKRLFRAVARQAGFGAAEPRANALDRERRHALIESLKGLRVPIDGTLGFDRAEVTAGGLDLAALDPGTMRVKGCEGLYACGEILDLAGPIGGLNFQSAFATAHLAGRDAAGR